VIWTCLISSDPNPEKRVLFSLDEKLGRMRKRNGKEKGKGKGMEKNEKRKGMREEEI
jgi:hypothetical protein